MNAVNFSYAGIGAGVGITSGLIGGGATGALIGAVTGSKGVERLLAAEISRVSRDHPELDNAEVIKLAKENIKKAARNLRLKRAAIGAAIGGGGSALINGTIGYGVGKSVDKLDKVGSDALGEVYSRISI